MTKNQKLAVGVSSSLLVVILVVLSLVSSADPIVTNPQSLCVPNTWTKKADFGGTQRHSAAGFSIGTKGYIGTGYSAFETETLKKDFWEWNQATNTWTQKADFGGGYRQWAVGFAVGSKGYMGTGSTSLSSKFKDFWEYNPKLNIWTRKADFAGGKRWQSTGFSIGSKGYLAVGYGEDDGEGDPFLKKDFWEYDPTLDKWIRKADIGGVERSSSTGFSMNGKGYLGTGSTGSGSSWQNLKDFWEYNPKLNIWTRKADFGGVARSQAISFSLKNKGYLGMGHQKDFWEYDPTLDKWTQKADVGDSNYNWGAVGFSIGDKGYAGTGYLSKILWEYCPEIVN